MKKTLYTALLATAMIPAMAVAQTSPTTPPAGATTADPATPAAPASGAMGATEAPAGGAMSTDAPETAASSTSAMEGPFVTVPPTGAWRATDLTGKSVEDTAGENIGSISDVLVDENGEVIAVLVGVGGFLGIGAKDVAVSMEALEFGPGSMDGLSTAPAADAAPAGGMAADPAAPAAGEAAAPTQPVVGEDNLPDRIVLAVTREELEAAPAYGEPETGDADDAMAPAGGTAPAAPQ